MIGVGSACTTSPFIINDRIGPHLEAQTTGLSPWLQTEAKACPIVGLTMDKGSMIKFVVPEVLTLGRANYAVRLGTPGRNTHE